MRSLVLRIATLTVVVANLAFNYLVSLEAPSRHYFNLFTPAAFSSIWGVIYLGFLGFCIFQLLPQQRKVAYYDGLNVPLLVANVLCAGWLAAYREQLVVPSCVILCASITCAVLLYIPVEMETRDQRMPWLRVPFSLFFGWLTFAALANLVALVGEPFWALTLMVLGTIVLVGLGIRLADPVLPAVLAWSAFTVAGADSATAHLSIATGVLSLLVAAALLVWRLSKHRRGLRHQPIIEIPPNLLLR